MREPIECDCKIIRCGLSIGVARVPADGQSPAAVLKAADLALYKAKADGRNTFRFFDPQMLEALAERRRVQDELRQALICGNLNVHFQPIVRASDSQLSGFEALVRWNHPERGLITPTEFIGVAEETGLIDEIGAFVLERACRAAASWPSHLQVAVNVSPLQVRRNTLTQAVLDALLSSGIEPTRLTLEITEAVLLEEETARATLTKIKGLGVRLALDDFGTGYSSLGYLQQYPFDKIKIDRSFITKIGEDSVSRAIVQAIVGIASAKETETVAEGVETALQAGFLRALQCTEMQGYFISKPLSLEEVEAYLETMASAA
jgi:predicted signal transduction protein with EAL and GGDEF domain